MKTKDLYPIQFDGDLYERKDCDDMFIQMYEGAGVGKICLNWNGGYYMSDGVYLYPDGSYGSEDGPEYDDDDDFDLDGYMDNHYLNDDTMNED